MHVLGIILLSILAAVVYGIVHDQVTARVCVEYFTIGHASIFPTEDPTLLGIGWGFVATWWVGLLLGVPLAYAARAGDRPKRSIASLVCPIATLLAVMAGAALGSGLAGAFLASRGRIALFGPLAEAVPPDRHIPFLADLWAHSASYTVGFLGGIVLIVHVWRSRQSRRSPGATSA